MATSSLGEGLTRTVFISGLAMWNHYTCGIGFMKADSKTVCLWALHTGSDSNGDAHHAAAGGVGQK